MPIFYRNHDTNETESFYVGGVIELREKNYYDDSDFYAVLWDEEKQTIRTEEYDTTRFGGGGSASVDCTPENLEKARKSAYKFMRKFHWDHYIKNLNLNTPEKSDEVKVVKGRKVPVGTVGILFWIGNTQSYSPSRWAPKTTKCGIALDNEKDEKGRYKNVAWTYLENLEVTDNCVKNKTKERFKISEAKSKIKVWKHNAIHSYIGFQAYPLAFVR